MTIETLAAFYNTELGAVQAWKDIDVDDTLGASLIAQGLAVQVGSGGGGGGAASFTVTLAYAEGSRKGYFYGGFGYDETYGNIYESAIKINDNFYASTNGQLDAGEYEVVPFTASGAGYFGNISSETLATVSGDAEIIYEESSESWYIKATGNCTITINDPE